MNYQKYWDERAGNWPCEYLGTTDLWKDIEPFIDPSWNVLEIGCGDGRWAPFFPNYTGIDVSPRMIRHARGFLPEKKFYVKDISLEIPSGFDLIFSFTVLMALTPRDFKKLVLPNTRILAIEPTKAHSKHAHTHDYTTKGLTSVLTLGDRIVWTNYSR